MIKVFNPFVTSPNAEEVYASDEAIARARAAALRKLERSSGSQPIQHWLQGAAQMTEAAMGGLQYQRAEAQEQQKRQALAAALTGLFGGGDASGAAGAPVQPAGGGAPAMPGAAPAAGPSPSAGAPSGGGGVDMRRLATIYALNPELGARIAMSEMEKMEARRKAAMPQPVKGENGSFGVWDPTTQTYRNIYTPPAPDTKLGANERLIRDGKVIVDAAPTSRVRLMTAEEKAAAKIPPELTVTVDEASGKIDVVNTGILPPAAQAQRVEQAQASRSSVNVNPGETAEDKGRGESIVKRMTDALTEGSKANEDAGIVEQLGQYAGKIEPGTKTALLNAIRERTGLALDGNADNVQNFQRIVQYLVPRQREPGSGASSDRDFARFEASLPSLFGTPGGNEIAIESMKSILDWKRQRASIASDWQAKKITGDVAVQRMDALSDPMVKFKAWEASREKPAGPTDAPAGPVAPPGTPMPAQPTPAPAPATPAQSDMRAPPATPQAPGRAPAQAQPTQPEQGASPRIPRFGEIVDYNGQKYQFRGGDPADPKNWDKR